MRIFDHASISRRAMLEQLAAPKVFKRLNTFVEHLRRRASSHGRRNCQTSAGGAASSLRVIDMRSTTCPGAQDVQAFEHLVEHLARLSILRRFRNMSRDEKLRFSTTSTTGEEKCRGVEFEILSTLAPFRELWAEFFAATSARVFLTEAVSGQLSAISREE